MTTPTSPVTWLSEPCPTCLARPYYVCRDGYGGPHREEPHPARTFPWPCTRRDAHGPHVIPTHEPEDGTTWPRPCLGVRAHPATMIGARP